MIRLPAGGKGTIHRTSQSLLICWWLRLSLNKVSGNPSNSWTFQYRQIVILSCLFVMFLVLLDAKGWVKPGSYFTWIAKAKWISLRQILKTARTWLFASLNLLRTRFRIEFERGCRLRSTTVYHRTKWRISSCYVVKTSFLLYRFY